MSKSPFDYVKSINDKTGYIFDESEKYPAYMVNKTMSFNLDTCLFANEINKYSQARLTDKQQYDFLYYAVPKKKRFGKWIKADEMPNLEVVCKFFNCSIEKAKEYLKILNDDQIEEIKTKMETGGRNGENRNEEKRDRRNK